MTSSRTTTSIYIAARIRVKGGCTCKILIVGTNNKLLGEPKQTRKIQVGVSEQRAQSDLRARPEWTHLRGAARGIRSSMYKAYINMML